MKIVLARPWNTTSMLIPNHGLGYLATALKKHNHEAIIVDCIRDHLDADKFAEIIRRENPELVGFQVYTFDLPVLKPYVDAVNRLRIPIVAGGPHPSAAPEDMAKRFPDIQMFVRGEAESALLQLVQLLNKMQSLPASQILEKIPGVYTKKTHKPKETYAVLNPDLDTLGMPDWDQISPLSYPVAPQGTFTKKLPVAPIIITRGCPYPCTFCAGKLISGKKIRSRSVNHVIEELNYLVTEFGIKEFHIQDDNFTFDRDYVLEFCSKLIASKLNLVWACPNGIRLDTLDPEVIKAMDTAGCYSVAVGIESGTQRILDKMRKQTTINDLIHKVREIRKLTKWYITGFFIIGYPGETIEEMQTTIRLSRRLPLDKANFGLLMPLPGTEVETAARLSGWNPDIDLLRMSEYRSPFTPEGVTQEQMRHLLQKAFIGFYARPKIIWRFIRQIHSIDQLKILFRRLLDVVKP